MPVGARIARPSLSKVGVLIEITIENASQIYSNVNIEKYVIMPNHLHIIIEMANVGAYGIRPNGNDANNNQGVLLIGMKTNIDKGAAGYPHGYSLPQRPYRCTQFLCDCLFIAPMFYFCYLICYTLLTQIIT